MESEVGVALFWFEFDTDFEIYGSSIGGWGWKQSGAETPTGNPRPAPIAPHARHDRSMARSISVARANCGPKRRSSRSSQKMSRVVDKSLASFREFQQTIPMVFFGTCLRYARVTSWNKGLATFIFKSISTIAKNFQFLVMVTKSECLSHVIKIRVWWISSLSQFQELQYCIEIHMVVLLANGAK